MDKDKFETQSPGHIKEGHQESDINVKGVVWSGIILAAGGFLAFVLAILMIRFLEKWEKDHEAKLTPMEQQLQQERELPQEGLGKVVPTSEGEIKPAPDWYGRGKLEDHLSRTIKTPRLQYDDEHDMQISMAQRGLPQVSGPFQPANVGAPSAAYPSGAADTGQTNRATPTAGAKK